MKPLPAQDMRTNYKTWAVGQSRVPAISNFMTGGEGALPNEEFDPHFFGQKIKTTYFDTAKYELRKNRKNHDKYITLRVRYYKQPNGSETYALSAKTESEKFRIEIPEAEAYFFNIGKGLWDEWLPAHLYARILEVSHEQELLPVITISAHRYAVENNTDRFSLDTEIRTDLGKTLNFSVLEYKSSGENNKWPALNEIDIYPIKISKFLWATEI